LNSTVAETSESISNGPSSDTANLSGAVKTEFGIIFDDMAFEPMPGGKQFMTREEKIHICDTGETSHIRVLYGFATIPAGTPRILTSNRSPIDIIDVSDPAIRRRVQVVSVTSKILENGERKFSYIQLI
jgi:hypothetical protein